MKFGRITIVEDYQSNDPGHKPSYWMSVNSGPSEGEGMEVSKEKLDALIEQFYEENF